MRAVMAILGGLAVASAAEAQSLGDRVRQTSDGVVRFSFAAREDVCGDGEGTIQSGPGHRRSMTITHQGRRDGCPCEKGPVRVSLRVREGAVRHVETYVGGDWRPSQREGTDAGLVGVREATSFLLAVARDPRHSAGDEAIHPAILADSVETWPDLLALARDTRAPRDARKSAVFWVGQAAGERATAGLAEVVDSDGDREVRESAVFALSQRPPDEGVPALIRVARNHRDPEIRRNAMFWLGQSEDPRALALFEEILGN